MSENDLRNELLNIEPLSVQRQELLQAEVRNMFEPTMSKGERMYTIASVLGAVGFAVVAAIVIVMGKAEPMQKTMWGVFGAISLGGAALWIRSLARSKVEIRRLVALSKIAPAAALVICLLLIINAVGNPGSESLAWAIFGVTFLILTVAIVLHNRIIVAELNQREQMLRIEYRIAEMNEK